jgi:hypothetical protein
MRKPSRLRAGLAAAALALGAGGVIAAAAPASASTVRGLNLNLYCQQNTQGTILSDGPSVWAQVGKPGVLNGPANVYSWVCTNGVEWTGISMNTACKQQYPGSVGIAYWTSYSNPYSWRCL